MAGFQGYADLDTALRASQEDNVQIYRTTSVTNASTWASVFKDGGAGQFPAAGSDPSGAGTTYSGATTGSLTFNNVSPKQRYLLQISMQNAPPSGGAVAGGVLLVYDRLVAVGGLSLTAATTLTVSTPSLPRYTTGAGVQPWIELPTVTDNSVAFTMSYTNQAGTSGQVTPSFALGSGLQLIPAYQIPLASASTDSGVRSVQSITITSTSATTGVMNVVLLKPLAWLNMPPYASNSITGGIIEQDFIMGLTALPRIFDGANLAFMYLGAAGAGTEGFYASLRTVYN